MRYVLQVIGLLLRASAAVLAAYGVVQIFDSHPFLGVGAIIASLALMVGGTELRSQSARRADLTDALYMSGDDMLGYRSHINRRHNG